MVRDHLRTVTYIFQAPVTARQMKDNIEREKLRFFQAAADNQVAKKELLRKKNQLLQLKIDRATKQLAAYNN